MTRDDDPRQRATESYEDYLARRLSAKRQTDPLAVQEQNRWRHRAAIDDDAPDPRDVEAIADLNAGIHEVVEDFAAHWMTEPAAIHARAILIDYLEN